MLKRMLMILMTASLVLALSACSINMVTGSGKVVTEKRAVSGFSSVSFAGLGELVLVQGATEGLTIEGEDNILAKIKVEVKAGKLTIGFERENWQDMINPTRPIKYSLAIKNLEGLELSGAGNAVIEGLKTNNLTVTITGAGGININKLDGINLTTRLTGAGNIEITGKVNHQEITLSGVGNYGCGNLESQTAKITLTGAGGATVWAKDTLDVTISGVGSAGYYASPKITKKITGVGVLNSLGNK